MNCKKATEQPRINPSRSTWKAAPIICCNMFYTTSSLLVLSIIIPLSAAEVHRWFIADSPALAQARSESWEYLGAYHSRRPRYIYHQRGDAAAGPNLRGVDQVIVQSKAEDTAYI